ncbi:MAG: hypothetical protein ACREJU_20335 [Nitrospiraceae bacterium]
MREILVRRVMQFLFKNSLNASDIIKTIKLPSEGKVTHLLDIKLGMHESEVRPRIGEYILREHARPIDGIDLVLSTNAWPEIFRFVFHENKLITTIVETGVWASNFQIVYSKVTNRISEMFAYSLKVDREAGLKYPCYIWEYADSCCYFQVVSDKTLNYNFLWFDFEYFGSNWEETFIQPSGMKYAALPTFAVIFAQDNNSRLISTSYLQNGFSKEK